MFICLCKINNWYIYLFITHPFSLILVSLSICLSNNLSIPPSLSLHSLYTSLSLSLFLFIILSPPPSFAFYSVNPPPFLNLLPPPFTQISFSHSFSLTLPLYSSVYLSIYLSRTCMFSLRVFFCILSKNVSFLTHHFLLSGSTYAYPSLSMSLYLSLFV